MASAITITLFACPGCNTLLAPPAPGPTTCPSCNWRGEAYLFTPLALDAKPAETALPEDATCIHHPRKKATAVCAGTGDYICSLCAIELDGQTFGAEYLNAGGKEKAGKAFDRVLPRPDNQIILYLCLLLVPYANVVLLASGFIWIPHAFFLYSKARRFRQQNELFARVMGRGRLVTLPIVLSLAAVGWIVGVFAVIVALMKYRI